MLNTKNLEHTVCDTVQLELARKQWAVAGQERRGGGNRAKCAHRGLPETVRRLMPAAAAPLTPKCQDRLTLPGSGVQRGVLPLREHDSGGGKSTPAGGRDVGLKP